MTIATQAAGKLAIKLGGTELAATMANALVAAGLSYPVAIEGAEDSAIEDAVGSENLAAVRVVFPTPQ
jgi:hypothetical protein